MRRFLPLPLLIFLPWLAGAALSPEQVEFFEKKIRPVLAQECYECHSSAGKKKGGLALDSRAGWQAGGDTGDAVVPGQVEKSLLIKSIRQMDPDLKMPNKGPKLEESVIRDFEAWVQMGAPDPRDAPATPEEVARDKAWPSVFQRRLSWWSFQPLTHPPVPAAGAGWAAGPVDRFLAQGLETAKLTPAQDADPSVVLRRLNYVLIGLPPTPEEDSVFRVAAAKSLSVAISEAADRLLASPRFGEKWARHWMDWVRYADSHGSEGDPAIPYAWRYRDYLIRAFNDDVPFPQLVREAIAGDLLEQPRVQGGSNESALGVAQFRMVAHGFTPTDPYDELATFTDNQIDTVSKAFLGLTVACARCHDHKFDAISQADYYALFGIFASCRPASVDINLPARQQAGLADLATQKQAIRTRLTESWLAGLGDLPARLEAFTPPDKPQKTGDKKKDKKLPPPADLGPLAEWMHLRKAKPEEWPHRWAVLGAEWSQKKAQWEAFLAQPVLARWDLRGRDFAAWQADGPAVRQGATAAGEFSVATEGEEAIDAIYPSGIYSNLFSDRHRGFLASPRFACAGGKLWLHVRGDGDARARYVVRNYPRSGIIYPKAELNGDVDQWVSWDMTYWAGDTLHLEICTDDDQPVETTREEHSSFGITEVRYVKDTKAEGPPKGLNSLFAFWVGTSPAPADRGELAALITRSLGRCLEHWRDGKMSDAEADFLGVFVRFDLLPNTLAELPEIAPLVKAYRQAEQKLAAPTRAPGLLEGYAFDQPLFTRGDHTKPAEPVPRRFLEAFDAKPYSVCETESGRRELAESLLSPKNPLTPRVIVNRLWSYVFGQGIVTTPDNFGRLGELPSHPELLDYLANEFQAQSGSMKSLIRTLVTSRAFRLQSRPSAQAEEEDPQNRWLSHFPSHRLEAEAIRDTMVALSGKLEGVNGGESAKGDGNRRSIYVSEHRNSLDPLLTAFDFPVPLATRGKRDSTNVPAQALTLLNDPGVAHWAAEWGKRIAQDKSLADDTARVRRMFAEAFNRPARDEEVASSLAFIQAAAAEHLSSDPPWQRLAEALFNAKELIYLQ